MWLVALACGSVGAIVAASAGPTAFTGVLRTPARCLRTLAELADWMTNSLGAALGAGAGAVLLLALRLGAAGAGGADTDTVTLGRGPS